MKLTLENYIKNPSGGRTRVAANQDLVRMQYEERYNKVLLRTAGRIAYALFKDKEGSRYTLYVRIPSEKTVGLFYDVVLDFTTTNDVQRRVTNIKDYNVRFFANDPNFMFTYANVFNKDNLLIPELKNKFDPVVFKQRPKVTNPNKIVGYVKSIYFAYLFYKQKGLENKLAWLNAFPYKQSDINKLCAKGSDKLREAQALYKLHRTNKYGSVNISQNDLANPDRLEGKAKEYFNRVQLVKTVDKVKSANLKRNKGVKTTKRVKYI